MNNFKILILEDSEDDFKAIQEILMRYEVTLFPNTEEDHDSLSNKLDLLANYSKYSNNNESNKNAKGIANQIGNFVKNFEPNLILLDVGINFNNNEDKSGLLLYKVFKERNIKAEIIICSKHNREDITNGFEEIKNCEWIYKRRAGSLNDQIVDKIVKKYNLTLLKNDKPLNIISKKNYWKINSKTIDWAVNFVFQLSIFVFACYAPISFYHVWSKGEENVAIQLAEHSFIAFLPMIIVTSFYIYYKRALSPYILNETTDDNAPKIKIASATMDLSKKLFISSFISYISILLLEDLMADDKTEDMYLAIAAKGLLWVLLFIYFAVILMHEKKTTK